MYQTRLRTDELSAKRRSAGPLAGVSRTEQAAGRLNGCPARIVTGYGSTQIVLTIDLAELGIDPAVLG